MSEPVGSPVPRDELVERARAGDHDAYRQLIETGIARLLASARLILRDTTRADDAVQDALVAAWRSLPGLRDTTRFDAWLHRLLVHACYRVARRERRHSVTQIPLIAPPDRPAADAVSTVEDRDELERAFRVLTVDQRAVLVLVYYADLSMTEVADALGIPAATAKSRMYRALAALRAALAADERSPVLIGGRVS
jgi:RNA polymerase sigma-70 factor (ECF subfamily)